jgi:hypothetical protein
MVEIRPPKELFRVYQIVALLASQNKQADLKFWYNRTNEKAHHVCVWNKAGGY